MEKETDSSAHVALSDRIDQISKTTLAATGALFAIGMVIDNIQLQELGIHDVSVVQPRFVLVGFAFLIYLLLPAVLFVTPVLVFRWFYMPRGANRRAVPWLRAVGGGIGAVIAAALLWRVLLPSPFFYFIERVRWSGTSAILVDRFWSHYLNAEFVPGAILLYVPMVIVAATIRGRGRLDSPKVRRTAAALVAVGVVGSVMPYLHNAYPNLARAVGGGSPLVAEIDLTSGEPFRPSTYQTAPRFPRLGPATRGSTQRAKNDEDHFRLDPHGKYVVVPIRNVASPTSQPAAETMLLWHESDGFVYVSRIAGWTRQAIVHAVPKDRIEAVRYRHGLLHFRGGRLERAAVNVDLEELMQSLLEVSVDLREVLRELKMATTKPLPPEVQQRLDELDAVIRSQE